MECRTTKRRKIDNNHDVQTTNHNPFDSLSDEVILNIFKYSVDDIKDFKKIGDLCKRFSVIIQDHRLYSKIKIVNGAPCDEIKPILSTYKKYINSLELRNVNLHDFEEVKDDFENLYNITLLKVKNLYVDGKGLEFIADVVKKCQNIRKFITSGLEIQNPNDWSVLLGIISKREIEEFSFHNNLSALLLWDINRFLNRNHQVLTSLKIPVMYEFRISDIGDCKNLKTLYLDPPLKFLYEFSHHELFKLNQLEDICFHTDHFNLDELCEFFSLPCRINLKKIQLFIGYDFDRRRLFEIIMKRCVNLEELSVSISRNGEHFALSLELIKFILYRFRKLKRLYLSIIDRVDLQELDRFLSIGMCPSLEIFRTVTCLQYGRNVLEDPSSIVIGLLNKRFRQMKEENWVDYSKKLKLFDELKTLVATEEQCNRARISFDRNRIR